MRNDPVRARLALMFGARTDTEYNRITPLGWALSYDHDDVARVLIQHGAKASTQTAYQENALLTAMRAGHVRLVLSLIESGADVNMPDAIGLTPLMAALTYRLPTGVIHSLLQHGADVNATSGETTPLAVSARAGTREITLLLLQKGADPDKGTSSGLSAVEWAALRGDSSIVPQLVHHGAQYGIHAAAALDDVAAVRKMLSHGVQVDSRNGREATPLWMAARAGSLRTVRLLIEGGANVRAGDTYGDTIILAAVTGGHLPVVELLASDGVALQVEGANGDTLLHVAARNGDAAMATFLIRSDCPVDAVNDQGKTPLHEAASQGSLEVVRLLLAAGASVDIPDGGPWGDSALHIAANRGHQSVCEALIKHGASVNARNKMGASPLQLALSRGHSATADALRRAGAIDGPSPSAP